MHNATWMRVTYRISEVNDQAKFERFNWSYRYDLSQSIYTTNLWRRKEMGYKLVKRQFQVWGQSYYMHSLRESKVKKEDLHDWGEEEEGALKNKSANFPIKKKKRGTTKKKRRKAKWMRIERSRECSA